MNDKLMLVAIRRLPEPYISDGTNVARHGRVIVAAHFDLPALEYRDGRWRKIDVTRAVRR